MNDVSICNLPTAALLEAANNPNHMEARHFRQLVDTMRSEGFLVPILVRPDGQLDGGAPAYRIIDGHHRYKAAVELEMPEIPCVVANKGPVQERLLRIALNRLRGEPDLTGVGKLLAELQSEGVTFDQLTSVGYSESEVTDLLKSVGTQVDMNALSEMELPTPDYVVEEAAEGGKVFELKLLFDSREEMLQAKRGLRRAAGKGKDMAEGLLKLLGEEKQRKAKATE